MIFIDADKKSDPGYNVARNVTFPINLLARGKSLLEYVIVREMVHLH